MNYQTFDNVAGPSALLDLLQNNLPSNAVFIERAQSDDIRTFRGDVSSDRLVIEFASGMRWGIEYYYDPSNSQPYRYTQFVTCLGKNLTLSPPPGQTVPYAFNYGFHHDSDSAVGQAFSNVQLNGYETSWADGTIVWHKVHLLTDDQTIYIILEWRENFFMHYLATENYISRCQKVPANKMVSFVSFANTEYETYICSPYAQFTTESAGFYDDKTYSSATRSIIYDDTVVAGDANTSELAYFDDNCHIMHRYYPRDYDDPDNTDVGEFPSIFGPINTQSSEGNPNAFAHPDQFAYGARGVSQYGSVVINDCIYWLHQNLNPGDINGAREREIIPGFELPFVKTLNIETVPNGTVITLPDGDYKVFPITCKGSYYSSSELPEETPDTSRSRYDEIASNAGVAVKIS